jgi:hypothetical protein
MFLKTSSRNSPGRRPFSRSISSARQNGQQPASDTKAEDRPQRRHGTRTSPSVTLVACERMAILAPV